MIRRTTNESAPPIMEIHFRSFAGKRRLKTRYGVMIGMTRNADDIMTIVTTAESCTVGRASKLKNPVRRARRGLTDARRPRRGGRGGTGTRAQTAPRPATARALRRSKRSRKNEQAMPDIAAAAV